MKRPAAIAIDLGAESCRVSLLRWIDGHADIRVVHRFVNSPALSNGSIRWDLDNITAGIVKGLMLCAGLAGSEQIASIGVDGWAVDYVRLGCDGKPLSAPYCYRDERTIEAEREVYKRISPETLYRLTGIQLLRLNTLFQLYADAKSGISPRAPWLTLPEYVTHWLGGERVAEYTNATHTQLVSLGKQEWCPDIFKATGIDMAAAPPIVPTGTKVGMLRRDLRQLRALATAELIVPACHDTASATAGIPLKGCDWAFISSGTWSLVGTVLDAPCATDDARVKNFTNLGGVGNSTCFLKNVNGMWLLQQCLESWERSGHTWTVQQLIQECEKLSPPDLPLDVDDGDLLLPGDMPARINEQRKRRGFSPIPTDNSGIPVLANVIFHGLAARYAQVLRDLQSATGRSLQKICVVGGGSKNTYLNRLTAEMTGLQVVVGPSESSTIGNFAVQLASLDERHTSSNGVTRKSVAEWAEVLADGMRSSSAGSSMAAASPQMALGEQ